MSQAYDVKQCPCDSGYAFAACCAPYLAGIGWPATALALMRSRYSAYSLGKLNYVLKTWHPTTRPGQIQAMPEQRWIGLKIRAATAGEIGDLEGTVEFAARYKVKGRGHRLDEVSRFRFEDGQWFYLDGIKVQRGP